MSKAITLTRQELERKSPKDFLDGEKIRVGKYLIFIKQGDWGVNVNTYAESDDNPMMPMAAGKMPSYIRRFIFER